jgi:hypothetical protein
VFASITLILHGKIAMDVAAYTSFIGSADIIYKVCLTFLIIFYIYLFVYLIYAVLQFLGIVVPKKRVGDGKR